MSMYLLEVACGKGLRTFRSAKLEGKGGVVLGGAKSEAYRGLRYDDALKPLQGLRCPE